MSIARVRGVVYALIVLSFMLIIYRLLSTIGPQEEYIPEQRNCVVSLLSEAKPAFVRFGEVLGFSLMKQKIAAKKIMMIIKGQDSEEVRTKLERVGWTIDVVDVIPQIGKPARDPKFRPLFTKLRAWNMTETCDRVVMIDLDALVIKNFEELFDMLVEPIKFAAAPDTFSGKYTFDINAGIFVCKPDRQEFESLLAARNDSKSNPDWAEQGFLNYYYKLHMLRLPITYNGNTAIFKHNKEDWGRLIDGLKIIHHTLDKPTGNGKIDTEPNALWYQVEKEMEEFLEQFNTPDNVNSPNKE
jgi:alpha-N-acetylglucosamine transferase